jgi:hypothetical protein
MKKHKRKLIIGGAIVVVAAIAWFLFRPELLFVDAKVWEAFPEQANSGGSGTQRSVLASGDFHSVAHQSHGVATIYRLSDGKHVLRLTDFETSNGPALHVYLVAAKDAADSQTVRNSDTIDLGELKGNKGDQNYELSTDLDLAKYQAVTIWCQRFSVNFATAPLIAPTDLSLR